MSPLPEEAELEDQVRWLLDRLLPVRAGIEEILATDKRLKADFFSGLSLMRENVGLGLSARTLRDLSLLPASLEFDIYWEGPRNELLDQQGP